MALTRDITATYRGPGAVMRRLLAMGENEGRALAFLMGACLMMFIAQWPRLAREAHLQDRELDMLLGGALMGWIFLAPLIFYALAFVSHWIARALGGQGSGFGSRLALFWSLLAAAPLFLLLGLTAGFIGPGLEQQIVGTAWLVAFLWFWLASLVAAHRAEATA